MMSETKARYKTEWTASELAKAAGVSTARIRQLLIKSKELRGRKVGYMWVVSDSEAQRWLARRKAEA